MCFSKSIRKQIQNKNKQRMCQSSHLLLFSLQHLFSLSMFVVRSKFEPTLLCPTSSVHLLSDWALVLLLFSCGYPSTWSTYKNWHGRSSRSPGWNIREKWFHQEHCLHNRNPWCFVSHETISSEKRIMKARSVLFFLMIKESKPKE